MAEMRIIVQYVIRQGHCSAYIITECQDHSAMTYQVMTNITTFL